MKYYLQIITCFFLSATIGCNKDITIRTQNISIASKEKILFPRKSTSPFLLTNKTNKSRSATEPTIPIKDVTQNLGMSFNPSIQDGISFKSAVLPIVDIKKLVKERDSYIKTSAIRVQTPNSYSFTSFDRIDKEETITQKTETGFKLNFVLFSIGKKNSFTSVFKTRTSDSQNLTYGELSIKVKHASYEFLKTPNTQNLINTSYLDKTFINELYNNSPSDLLQICGPAVITGFISGGEARAMYIGNTIENKTEDETIKNMEDAINFSYNAQTVPYKSGKFGLDGNIGIGNGDSEKYARERNIENFQASVVTYGGGYGFPSFTTPKGVSSIGINLSGWASSLNDESTHVLIDILDSGLRPLNKFINETNLKYYYSKYIGYGHISGYPKHNLKEPNITVYKTKVNSDDKISTICLNTRFGDKIILNNRELIDGLRIYDESDLEQMNTDELFLNKLRTNFGLKFVETTESPSNIGYDDSHYSYATHGFDSSKVQKFTNENYGITYLIYTNGTNTKFAFSIQDDFILDTYGIREWVNSLETKEINYATFLKEYDIIAL